VAGGAAFGILNVLADVIAYQADLWWYTDSAYSDSDANWHAPFYWYLAAALAVAGISLIGWRVHRGFGIPGLAGFLALFALYGLIRDWRISETFAKDLIEFGDGAVPWLADYVAWFLLMGAALAVQTALRGDPKREQLART
jgi:hypothetical protein